MSVRPPTRAAFRACVLSAFALTTALLAGCGKAPKPAAATGDGPPRLLVVSSQIGYVEPCGCTVDLLLGGIDRMATLIDAERRAGPAAVLVVGPHLFDKAPKPHQVGQEEAKAQLIARAMRRIGVDAVAPTAKELLRGRPFFDGLGGPIGPDVTANIAGGHGRLLTLGTLKVGVFGVATEGDQLPGGTATDPSARAKVEAQRLRDEGATVVVALSNLSRRATRKLSRKARNVDLWILGDRPKEEAEASPVKGGYLIEAGDRGRNVGRIILHDAEGPGPLKDPAGDGARARKALQLQLQMRSDMYRRTPSPALKTQIDALQNQLAALAENTGSGKRFSYQLLPITKEVKAEPTLSGWVKTYNTNLKAINLAAAGEVAPVPEGKSGYAGDGECAECHEEAVRFWQKTAHAGAWQTLVKADKTFDSECVSCHVTGWRAPGGSVLGKTEGLQNVQCEVCHGPSLVHVDLGGDENWVKTRVPEAVCGRCHNDQHSPKFDYQKYLKEITGPGHKIRVD